MPATSRAHGERGRTWREWRDGDICGAMNTRRQFLIKAPVGLAATIAACHGGSGPTHTATTTAPTPDTPGAPTTFNTAPPVGPEVTPTTFAEAEKLMQVAMTPAQREMAAKSWRTSMAGQLERRTGPRKLELEPSLAPATRWTPLVAGEPTPTTDRFVRSTSADAPLPGSDADIGFATVAQLSRWIESRTLTSERLTQIYLDRIRRFDPKLRAIITLTPDV